MKRTDSLTMEDSIHLDDLKKLAKCAKEIMADPERERIYHNVGLISESIKVGSGEHTSVDESQGHPMNDQIIYRPHNCERSKVTLEYLMNRVVDYKRRQLLMMDEADKNTDMVNEGYIAGDEMDEARSDNLDRVMLEVSSSSSGILHEEEDDCREQELANCTTNWESIPDDMVIDIDDDDDNNNGHAHEEEDADVDWCAVDQDRKIQILENKVIKLKQLVKRLGNRLDNMGKLLDEYMAKEALLDGYNSSNSLLEYINSKNLMPASTGSNPTAAVRSSDHLDDQFSGAMIEEGLLSCRRPIMMPQLVAAPTEQGGASTSGLKVGEFQQRMNDDGNDKDDDNRNQLSTDTWIDSHRKVSCRFEPDAEQAKGIYIRECTYKLSASGRRWIVNAKGFFRYGKRERFTLPIEVVYTHYRDELIKVCNIWRSQGNGRKYFTLKSRYPKIVQMISNDQSATSTGRNNAVTQSNTGNIASGYGNSSANALNPANQQC